MLCTKSHFHPHTVLLPHTHTYTDAAAITGNLGSRLNLNQKNEPLCRDVCSVTCSSEEHDWKVSIQCLVNALFICSLKLNCGIMRCNSNTFWPLTRTEIRRYLHTYRTLLFYISSSDSPFSNVYFLITVLWSDVQDIRSKKKKRVPLKFCQKT